MLRVPFVSHSHRDSHSSEQSSESRCGCLKRDISMQVALPETVPPTERLKDRFKHHHLHPINPSNTMTHPLYAPNRTTSLSACQTTKLMPECAPFSFLEVSHRTPQSLYRNLIPYLDDRRRPESSNSAPGVYHPMAHSHVRFHPNLVKQPLKPLFAMTAHASCAV
jgi:hypothetical protein